MAAPSCDKPVPYCSCTTRRVNLDSTLTSTTCGWCERFLPDDKAIYLALKDHVQHLQLLGSNKKVKWKKIKKKEKKNGERPVMDAIESLPDREDIQELLTKYEAGVLRASVKVLVKHDSLELRSLLSSISICKEFPPAAEPEKVVDEEAGWDATPEPATEQMPLCDYACEPEIAAQGYQETNDAEPEAIEEGYVEVQDMEEKPCDDDFSPPPPHGDDSDALTSDKPPEGAARSRDPEQEGGISDEHELPDKPDISALFRNLFKDEDGALRVQLGSQYELMVQLQRYIERACYAYGRRELPETLSRNGWDCDEAVTLDRWMREFLDRPEIFDVEASAEILQSLFRRLRKIQAINLDRTRLTCAEIHEFLSDAQALMDVLNVSSYKELMKKLDSRIGGLLFDFAVMHQSLRRRRDEKMKQVKSERARLDLLEMTILAEMEDNMGKNQSMVKQEIRIALDKTAAKFATDMEWEKDGGE